MSGASASELDVLRERVTKAERAVAALSSTIHHAREHAARLGITVGAIDGALYGAFGQRQCSPDRRAVAAHIVQRRLPRQAGLRIAAHRLPDAAQQAQRRAGRGGGKIGGGFGMAEGMPARTQPAPRQRQDRSAKTRAVQRLRAIHRGQARAQ